MFCICSQELKAQFELHNNIHNEAGSTFESAMRIIPVADEMLQRQFYSQLEDRWRGVSDKINTIQTSIIQNLSSQEVPFSDKLSLLEQELQEVKATVSDIRGVIRNEEELDLYIKRLQVM
jgi:nesprin-1